MIWIPISIAILLFLYLFIGFLCVLFLFKIKRTSREKAHEIDVKNKMIPEDLSFLERKEVVIPLSDGSQIHGDISIPKNPKGLAIFCHGYTWNREGQIKYALMFYRRGYAIFLYDHRGHGDNTTKFNTIGYKEAKDLNEIISYWRKDFKEEMPIILHGESMGAATVLGVLKYRQDVSLVISDCGFSNFHTLLAHKMKQYKVPLFLLPAIRLSIALFFHFDMNKFNPGNLPKDNKVPLLIIHGKEDDFVPLYQAHEIEKNCSSKHKLYEIEKAKHAENYFVNPEGYEKIVSSFLDELSL